MKTTKLIAITGVARSGKDTLCAMILDKLRAYDVSCERMALADELKNRIRADLMGRYCIDVLNCSATDKEKIRPELVAYGKKMRLESEGTFWTKILDEKIAECSSEVVVVTDIRYAEYKHDEVYWVKSKYGLLIHVQRYDENGVLVPPPNEDEARNDPKIKAMSDMHIAWPTNPVDKLSIDFADKLDTILLYARA